jgi:hypothetical protein
MNFKIMFSQLNTKFIRHSIKYSIVKLGFFLLFFQFILLCSCNSKHEQKPIEESLITEPGKQNRILKTDEKGVILQISSATAILRAEPDIKSAEIVRLKKGTELIYLNEISRFTTLINIEGIEYDEPWLKVKDPKGNSGWIYGGCIRLEGFSSNTLNELIFDRRLFKLFGDDLSQKIKVYQKEIANLETLPAFRMLFRRSDELRNEINKKITELLLIAKKEELPDFFWLNETMPGFIVHLVKDKKEYRLFRDFRFWNVLADKTDDISDNNFIEIFLIAYQSDSIEYLHQDWNLYLEENEKYSLLGRGIHQAVMDGIELALEQSGDFEPELSVLKQKLLDDISFCNDYWETKQEIIKELDAILNKKYKILTKADRIELANRKKKILSNSKNKIRTGLYNGGD